MNENNKIQSNINKYGWHFLFVFDPEGKKESFSYSIGFEETFNYPEIMVFGLEKEIAHQILTDIADDLKNGLHYEVDKKLNNVLSGDLKVVFKKVNTEAFDEFLGTAVNFYQKPFRALVMFWPDKKSLFPFEDGCVVTIQNEALKIV